MKLKIEEQVTREIDVEFPLFTTDGLHYYKFENENNCTEAMRSNFTEGYVIRKHIKGAFPQTWMLNEAINEEQYNRAYERALDAIINKL